MADVERGAAIIKEICNSASNRKHAATAGSACMHAWEQVCVCGAVRARVCARACVYVCMYVCASATRNVGWRRPAERTHA